MHNNTQYNLIIKLITVANIKNINYICPVDMLRLNADGACGYPLKIVSLVQTI